MCPKAKETPISALAIARSVLLSGTLAATAAADVVPSNTPNLAELSLEELANTRVTLVSKTPKAWRKVAGPVEIVTPEDIRGSGLTSLAEAVRDVPGVHIASINSSQWGVGVRGFTNRT